MMGWGFWRKIYSFLLALHTDGCKTRWHFMSVTCSLSFSHGTKKKFLLLETTLLKVDVDKLC